MLVPFDTLIQLPRTTIDNLIKEYLFSQLEDGSFSQTDNQSLQHAINQCYQSLQSGLLLVEYSEEDESIAIKHKDNITNFSR